MAESRFYTKKTTRQIFDFAQFTTDGIQSEFPLNNAPVADSILLIFNSTVLHLGEDYEIDGSIVRSLEGALPANFNLMIFYAIDTTL